MEAPPISEDQMDQLLEWIDKFSFDRTKKNLNRDFSDGVLVAEIFKQYFPNLVQIHNYPAASSSTTKYINWKTLNQKVCRKLNFQIHKSDIENIITIVPGTVERVLYLIYNKIKKYEEDRAFAQNLQNFSMKESARKIKPVDKNSSNVTFAKDVSLQLAEREEIIRQLRETIDILETKMKKMEQLNRLKDSKIESLIKKLEEGT